MSFPWSKEVIDADNDYVRELISKAITKTEYSIDYLEEACQLGGPLTGNDAFRISGQMLHLKNAVAILKEILESTEPERPVPTLDEDGELDGKT